MSEEIYARMLIGQLLKSDDVTIIERLKGGMSHLTYKIMSDGIYYVARIVGKNGNMFINRRDELEALKSLKNMNITNDTIYFNLETGHKIATYIEGTVFTDLDYKTVINKIVDSLKLIHSSKLLSHDFIYLERLSEIEKELSLISTEYLSCKQKWTKLLKEKYENDEKVFCHNDAQRSNLVLSNDKVYILDFEFVGNNSIYYDLASFGNVDFEDALNLGKAYLGKLDDEDIKHIKFYRVFQCLMWHLVATYKEEIGLSRILELDFNKLADNYLKFSAKLLSEICLEE